MATAGKYLNISQDRLLGYQSFKDRFFDYLRGEIYATLETVYRNAGLFGHLTMAGDGNDKFKISDWPTDAPTAVDGSGHIMDMRAVTDVVLQTAQYEGIQFENAISIEYQVALQASAIPANLFINPLTGLPMFDYEEEIIGFAGTPNVVVDNTDGTLTVTVDSITESGVSNAGRKVFMWKISPHKNALTEGVAREFCPVVWSGGANKIITVANFGQGIVPSTTAADYVVVLVGPRVSRNVDLLSVPDCTYVGKVTGVGAGSPPTVFDYSGQSVAELGFITIGEIIRSVDVGGIFRSKIEVDAYPGEAEVDQIRVRNPSLSPEIRFSVDEDGDVNVEGDLTVANKISIGDELFNIDFNSGNPKIQFANAVSGGVLVYRRIQKDLTWKMQGVDEVVLAQGPILKLGDYMFNLDYSGGYPRLQFGHDDYFKFDRTIDTLTWNSNAVLGCFGYADTPGFFVGGTSFSLKYNAAGNQIFFDTNDSIEYVKASDFWSYRISGVEFLKLGINKLTPVLSNFDIGDTTHYIQNAYITEQYTSRLLPPPTKVPYTIQLYGDIVAGISNTLGTTGTRWANGFFSTVTASTIKSTSLTIRSETDGDVNVFVRGAIVPVTGQNLVIGSPTVDERINNGYFDYLNVYLGLSVAEDKVTSNLIPDVATRTLGRTGLRWDGFFGNLTVTTLSLSSLTLASLTVTNTVGNSLNADGNVRKVFGYGSPGGISIPSQGNCNAQFGTTSGTWAIWADGSFKRLCLNYGGTWYAYGDMTVLS